MKKKFLSSLFAIGMIATAFVMSCSKKDDSIAVTGVQLSDNEIVIVEGGTATLTATILPENADNKAVTWTSSDPEKVSVNENGAVTALVEEGIATITVTTQDGGKTASCKVKIEKEKIAVTGVTLPETLGITAGSTAILIATITPEDATDKTVTWTSENENIATIDQEGKVTAKSAGETTIKVTTRDGGKTATCQIKVTPTANIAPSATHYITMVTQKPTTEKLRLQIRVANEADKAGVWIDLNNNGKKDTGEEITNFTSEQGYEFTSPIITLYGKVTCLNSGYYCRLSQLDISHNTNLVELFSYDNPINTIDLTKHIGLQSLGLYGAGLTELDLSQNTNLTWIDLGKNKLKELNLNAQKELTELRVLDNQLTTLDVSQNTKLRKIACYANQIKGTGMDDLIARLPTREATNKGWLYVKNEIRSSEQNEITATQIAAAKAKNWLVFIWTKEADRWVEQ